MNRLILFLLAFSASPALAQASPCYWSGSLTKCFPPLGIGLTGQQAVQYGDATTNYVALKAPASVTTYTLTWPAAQGGSGTTLNNNGSGVLSWVTAGSGTVTSVSGTPPIQVAMGTSTPSISITQAGVNGNGYLSSTDWQTFNGGGAVKASATLNGYLGSSDWQSFNAKQATVSATAPITFSANTVAITQSGSNGNGYLSSSDWQAFNSVARVAATAAVSGYLTSTDWAAFNSGGRVASTSSLNGYLNSTDWTTFNSKVGTARTISTTAPLSGGGNLTADRTLTITQAGNNGNGYLSSGDWQTFNQLASPANRGSVSYEDSNTYTPTLGGARSIAITIKWARVGKVASVSWTGSTGVGCAADTFHTGASSLPAAITPAAERDIQVQVQDNNTIPTATGYLQFNSDGTFQIIKSFAASTFTNAQNCGWYAGSGSYPVN